MEGGLERLDGVKVARGGMYLALQSITSTIIGVLGYALLARVLSKAEMGAVAGLMLLISIFQLVTSLGLPSSLARFVSISRGDEAFNYLLSAMLIRLPLALASSIIMLLIPVSYTHLTLPTICSV